MGVLGILTCEILELEFARRLATDKDVSRIAGTFFIIPGWTTHWRRMFEQECGNLSVDLARRLFKDYERSLLVSTPLMSIEQMKQNSKAFNDLFCLRTEVCKGTLSILQKIWDSAKRYLNSES
ncbi:MAG: DUF1638 domain-containing protein [Deltaproteobacteria bacterium]|jgi:hypothetical protein|nr:DUF1638 domain-containing protein [Deltaproteobacteria bacterium]MBW2482954.1 DUF1638 domain-containing protein [Deltaproteobacteria bacterium]